MLVHVYTVYTRCIHSVYIVYTQCIVSALKTQRSRASTSMNTTGANWRLWSKRQLHSQRFADFLHCHALVNLIGAWTLVFWYMLLIGLCNVSIISYIVLFWHLTVENSTYIQQSNTIGENTEFSDIGGFTCEVPIILAPPSNHIGAKSVPPQSHRRHLQICNKMYLSELQIVFVRIAECICPNWKMYLSKSAHWQSYRRHIQICCKKSLWQKTLTYRKNPSMAVHLYTDLPYYTLRRV